MLNKTLAVGISALALTLATLGAPTAKADGPGHTARIHHSERSSVSGIAVCKSRHSKTECARKKNNVIWLRRGHTTKKGIDVDGGWCPPRHDCRLGIIGVPGYKTIKNRNSDRSKFFYVRGSVTWNLRVM